VSVEHVVRQELLLACGVWMRFSLSFIFSLGEFSEVDGGNYILGA